MRADQGGYQDLLEAVRLVDENLAAAPSSADDLRLKARLLAVHPQLAKRREAAAIFEKLVENQMNAAAEDRFRLAQLYLAAGDWTKARRQLLALLAAQGSQPRYVAAYARALMDHKEFSDAQQWIDHLEEIAPEQNAAVQYRAEVQFRRGNTGQALATLTNYIEKTPAGSAERAARTLAAATELETLASLPSDAGEATGVARRSCRRRRNSIGIPSVRTPNRGWSWSVFWADKSGSTRPSSSWKRRGRPPSRRGSP